MRGRTSAHGWERRTGQFCCLIGTEMLNFFDRMLARPAVYDCIQRVFGLQHTLRRLRPLFEDLDGLTVLDLGAGTGIYRRIMPPGIRYIWLDNDPQKLRGFLLKNLPGLTVLGDVTNLPLREQSVDVIFCCAVSHHLTEEQVQSLFREMARVCRRRAIFLDPLDVPGSLVSRLLWKYDRGSFPRSRERLHELMGRSFDLIHDEPYRIYHSYALWVGVPKREL